MATSDTIAARKFPSTVFKESWDEKHEIMPASAYTNGKFSRKWYAYPEGVNADYPYEFSCMRIYTYVDEENSIEKAWDTWSVSNIALWAHYGQNASFYTLTLDNQQDTVLYNDRNTDTKKDLHCSGCTTSYIRLTKGTLKQEELVIDELYINDTKFVTQGQVVSTEQELTLTQQKWTIKLQAIQTDSGIQLNLNSGTITPIEDASNGFSNDIVRIPITVKNNTEGVTKTVIWTVTALWNKQVLHHYKLFLSPGSFSLYQYISTTYGNNGSATPDIRDATYNTTTGVTCTVFQDDENNSWHAIKDYSYYIKVIDLNGGRVGSILGPSSGEKITWSQSDLISALSSTTSYKTYSSRGGTGGSSLIVQLYVNDPNYKTGTVLDSDSSYYLVDQQDFTIMYNIVNVVQGATGAQGAAGASGSSGTSVSVSDPGDYYILTVGGKSYYIAKATT